jgi:hypothetical protein
MQFSWLFCTYLSPSSINKNNWPCLFSEILWKKRPMAQWPMMYAVVHHAKVILWKKWNSGRCLSAHPPTAPCPTTPARLPYVLVGGAHRPEVLLVCGPTCAVGKRDRSRQKRAKSGVKFQCSVALCELSRHEKKLRGKKQRMIIHANRYDY